MKKIIITLSLFLLICGSCSSDSSEESNKFTSSIVADGIGFKPNGGTYNNQKATFESQTQLNFVFVNKGSDAKESLSIIIMFPTSRKSITGIYDFGLGTADELLVNVSFSRGNRFYPVIGYSLNVIVLGDSIFRFEFIDALALDGVNNFKEVEFKGNVEGKFEFIN